MGTNRLGTLAVPHKFGKKELKKNMEIGGGFDTPTRKVQPDDGVCSGDACATQQPVVDTPETASYKEALNRRLEYLRNEMYKVQEARRYMNTEEWQKRARVHETIDRATSNKQD